MRVFKKSLSILLLVTFMVTTYGTFLNASMVYASTPEKKEKFIVKHQDNERLKQNSSQTKSSSKIQKQQQNLQ